MQDIKRITGNEPTNGSYPRADGVPDEHGETLPKKEADAKQEP